MDQRVVIGRADGVLARTHEELMVGALIGAVGRWPREHIRHWVSHWNGEEVSEAYVEAIFERLDAIGWLEPYKHGHLGFILSEKGQDGVLAWLQWIVKQVPRHWGVIEGGMTFILFEAMVRAWPEKGDLLRLLQDEGAIPANDNRV